MKDTKEVVLFFHANSTFTPIEVVNEIKKRYEELGNPFVLLENEKTGKLLFLFNENPSLQMQCTREHFTVVCDHTYFDKMTSIVFDLVDTFGEFSCEFKRIGYISNVFLSPKCIDKMKKKFLKCEEFEGVKEFNLGWHRELDIKDGSINCWERMITDKRQFKDLLCQYDCNTLVDEEIVLEMKFIKSFFKVADEYIESRTNF